MDEPDLHALLTQYNAELEYLESLGREYVSAFPESSRRLGMGAGEERDVHVQRLLEGVAFLTAELHLHQQGQLQELARGLAELVNPGFLRPVPSLGLAQIGLVTEDFAALASGRRRVPRGSSFRDTVGRVFRATRDLVLLPFSITAAAFENSPTRWSGCPAALTLILSASGPLHEIVADRLPLYVGSSRHSAILFEFLARRVEEVCFFAVEQDGHRRPLEARGSLRPHLATAGHPTEDGWDDGFDGHRLLLEYQSRSETFCFLDLDGVGAALREVERTDASRPRAERTRALEVVVFFDGKPQSAPQLRATDVLLNALPVINLVKMQAEVMRADGRPEQELVIDRHQIDKYEIFSVLGVTADERALRQVHGGKTALLPSGDGSFSTRRAPVRRTTNAGRSLLPESMRVVGARVYHASDDEQTRIVGTRMYVSAVDPRGAPYKGVDLRASVLACERPVATPIDDVLAPIDVKGSVRAEWLVRPSEAHTAPWRGQAGLDALAVAVTDLGALLAPGGRGLGDLLATMVGAAFRVNVVKTIPIARRMAGDGLPASIVRGLEVRVTVPDNAGARPGGLALLCAVIQRFLAGLTTLNSFIELVLVDAQDKEQMRWPAMTGTRLL